MKGTTLYEASQAVEIRRLVRNGAEFLDLAVPSWAERIRLTKLNMMDVKRCILGQLFGSYREGTEELGDGDWDWGFQHGFSPTTNFEPVYRERWTEEINERLS